MASNKSGKNQAPKINPKGSGARVRAAVSSGLFSAKDLKGTGTFHQRVQRAEKKMSNQQAAELKRTARKFVANVDQYRPKKSDPSFVPPPTPGGGKKKKQKTPFVGPPLPGTKKKSGGKFVPPPYK